MKAPGQFQFHVMLLILGVTQKGSSHDYIRLWYYSMRILER